MLITILLLMLQNPEVETNWDKHRLGRRGCVERGVAIAAAKGMTPKVNDVGVYMARPNEPVAVVIRCDIRGKAVTVTVGPPGSMQTAVDHDDVRRRFRTGDLTIAEPMQP